MTEVEVRDYDPEIDSYLRGLDVEVVEVDNGQEVNRRARLVAERANSARIRRDRALKQEMVQAYGGACTCCGEDNLAFLTLEHRNGRTPHDDLGGSRMWRLAKNLGWPEQYTVLCYNCNIGTYKNGGRCPHEDVNERIQVLREEGS